MDRVKETINWLAALGLIVFYARASMVSLDPTKTMDPSVIIGIFALVYLLMYGAEKTNEAIKNTDNLLESIPGGVALDELLNTGDGGGGGGGDDDRDRDGDDGR